MSRQNKVVRWTERQNYLTSLKITQKYYINREIKHKHPVVFLIKITPLLAKRSFLLVLNFLRFNPAIVRGYFAKLSTPRHLIKHLTGIHRFAVSGLLQQLEPAALRPAEMSFAIHDQPVVSIIIAVYNQLPFTWNCLRSILSHTKGIRYEVIVIDDCSTDATSVIIPAIPGVRYFRNTQNMGFLKSCNQAASESRGTYLCLVNNDVQVCEGWLKNMLDVFSLHPDTGVVGPKLIYPYGLLQEAGATVNYLGQPVNYGRYEDPAAAPYNYLRETDYCSGACLVFVKSDIKSLASGSTAGYETNIFDERFAPAYYEDTDLCFSMRYDLHKKVYYQPLSTVVHFEGISSGKTITPGSVKEYQQVNSEKFKQKWEAVLAGFPKTVQAAADKFVVPARHILFIDSTLPFYDKESGSKRLYEIMNSYMKLDYHVTFMAYNSMITEPYFSEMTTKAIRVMYSRFPKQRMIRELQEILPGIGTAWICRPELNAFYSETVRKFPVRWIYDTIDLHFLRVEREFKLTGSASAKQLKKLAESRIKEIALASEADITLAITDTEREILESEGAKNVVVVPNIHRPYAGVRKTFSEREGICFIGGFKHLPNIDSAFWLVNEIMPLIWRILPEVKLFLLGSNPTPEINQLASDRVVIPGYVPDVSSYFLQSRVFVAPLRYGAGMKGKIGHSFEFGLPVITTTIGAEGMHLIHGEHALIANDTESFAREVVGLYRDQPQWERISRQSFERVSMYSPENVLPVLKKIIGTDAS